MSIRKKLISIPVYLGIVLILLYLAFPFYWSFITSFKDIVEVRQWLPTLFPRNFTLQPYVFSLLNTPVAMYLLNSFIYSLSTALVVVATATVTTYGLSMYSYKGSEKIFLAFFFSRVIPTQILWLPLLVLYSKMGLINSRLGLVIYLTALSYPLCIWMLRGLFDVFPRSILDSAAIDGCTRIGTLLRVVLPVVAPGVAAVFIISFFWSWGEFMFSFLLINSNKLKPITIGIYYFVGDQETQWHYLAATEVMALFPILLFAALLQRHIVSGLTAGAVKG